VADPDVLNGDRWRGGRRWQNFGVMSGTPKGRDIARGISLPTGRGAGVWEWL